jgi:23S rRNA U2552 (ribose-2'-O)-methylase RlmE/FtsJ
LKSENKIKGVYYYNELDINIMPTSNRINKINNPNKSSSTKNAGTPSRRARSSDKINKNNQSSSLLMSGKIDRTKIIDTFKRANAFRNNDDPQDDTYLLRDDAGNRYDLPSFNQSDSDSNISKDNDYENESDLEKVVEVSRGSEDNNQIDDYIQEYINYDMNHFGTYKIYDEDNLRGGDLADDLFRMEEVGKQLKNEDKYDKYIGRSKIDHYEAELEDNKVPLHREIVLKNNELVDFSKQLPNAITHQDVTYPKFSLGFNHWIHASKNKTEIFASFSGKKRVYQVINGYERYVDDYDESIGNVSDRFFNIQQKPKILSRAFYKLWEIFYYFDLINLQEKKFVSAHLAEGPGSFIQATMFFREMYSKDSKNDVYHGITLHGENEEDESLNLEREFTDYYAKEKPQRLFIHKTYDRKTSNDSKERDNGDLTKTKTIENFKKSVNTKVDLVTADGGFEWTNENIQEQECAILIYSEILTAINIQKKGGHFVLKVFETFTKTSLKFILLLKYFYEEVHIVKPFTSRESNSERYLVCRKFKFEEKQITNLLQNMMKLLDDINSRSASSASSASTSSQESKSYLIDIFPTVKIPDELIINVISINVVITNQQFCVINKMIEYINESNFHGELYMRYKSRQINLTKYWIETFMTEDKDYDKAKIKARKLIETADKLQKTEYNKFQNSLIEYNVEKENTKVIPKNKAQSRSMSRPKNRSKSKSRSRSRSNSKSRKVNVKKTSKNKPIKTK